MDQPRAGVHYPRSTGEFRAWFRTDADCLDYLEWLPGLRGGRAKGKKVLTGIAVEVKEPKGIGRCRMAILADGSFASLHPFVTSHVEPDAKVITDAWLGYHGLARLGYAHERRSQRAARARGDDPGELRRALPVRPGPAAHKIIASANGCTDLLNPKALGYFAPGETFLTGAPSSGGGLQVTVWPRTSSWWTRLRICRSVLTARNAVETGLAELL